MIRLYRRIHRPSSWKEEDAPLSPITSPAFLRICSGTFGFGAVRCTLSLDETNLTRGENLKALVVSLALLYPRSHPFSPLHQKVTTAALPIQIHHEGVCTSSQITLITEPRPFLLAILRVTENLSIYPLTSLFNDRKQRASSIIFFLSPSIR